MWNVLWCRSWTNGSQAQDLGKVQSDWEDRPQTGEHGQGPLPSWEDFPVARGVSETGAHGAGMWSRAGVCGVESIEGWDGCHLLSVRVDEQQWVHFLSPRPAVRLTSCPWHRGRVGGREGAPSKSSPQGNHFLPLLFLAPSSWSSRVSVAMQMRGCWRCW